MKILIEWGTSEKFVEVSCGLGALRRVRDIFPIDYLKTIYQLKPLVSLTLTIVPAFEILVIKDLKIGYNDCRIMELGQ